jgi:hypothetical protein
MTLILLIIFGLMMFNSEYLASREPSKTGMYRWVGQLFYKRENLLLIFCLTLNSLFSLLLIDLVIMLIRGKLELAKGNGTIFKNGKYFITQTDIDRTELFDSNKNSAISIYLKSLENALNKRESYIEKLRLKLFLMINKNKIQIRLTFLDKSVKNYQKIDKFIVEQKNYS